MTLERALSILVRSHTWEQYGVGIVVNSVANRPDDVTQEDYLDAWRFLRDYLHRPAAMPDNVVALPRKQPPGD